MNGTAGNLTQPYRPAFTAEDKQMTEIHDPRLHAYNPSSPECLGDANLEKEARIDELLSDDDAITEALIEEDFTLWLLVEHIKDARQAKNPLDRSCALVEMMQVFEDFLDEEVSEC
jgi:hypothetical protein